MKKVIIPALVAVAMTIVSCGNKANQNANGVDSAAVTTEQVDEQAQAATEKLQDALTGKDSETLTAAFEKVSEEYKALVEEGKLEEAKAYASKVQEFINTHAEELSAVTEGNTTITNLVNTVKNLPTDAQTTAEEAAAAVKSDVKEAAETAVENAKDAATEKVNEVKEQAAEKANEAVTNVKDKANKKVEEANKKATDAINKATDKLKLK